MIKSPLCLGIFFITFFTLPAQELDREVHIIFDRLIDASGLTSLDRPELHIKNSESYGAYLDRSKRPAVIGIERKAIDICRSFGEEFSSAIAGLLAHEIQHYQLNHQLSSRGQNPYLNGMLRDDQHILNMYHEVEADAAGGFLTLAAGYTSVNLMPDLLAELYEGYGIEDPIEGYPSLEDRQDSARASGRYAHTLEAMFEMGSYLSMLAFHQEAASLYAYIAETFKSREVYNNAGINYFLKALRMSNGMHVRFAYPLEIDPYSRLETLKSGPYHQEDLDKIIKRAKTSFEEAISLDETYIPAYINLACLYDLQGEGLFALAEIDRAIKMARQQEEEKLLLDALLAQGIIFAHSGTDNLAAARENFRQVLEASYPVPAILAELNLKALDDEFLTADRGRRGFFPNRQQIEGVDLDQFNRERRDYDLRVVFKDYPFSVFSYKDLNNSRIFMFSTETEKEDDRFIYLHTAYPGYQGATNEGIEIRSSYSSLKRKYKSPSLQVESPSGSFLLYREASLLFFLDEQARVNGWLTYFIHN
ncbi:MAG: hypothetical protein AAF587_14290 [Bacteroidota bacterium]